MDDEEEGRKRVGTESGLWENNPPRSRTGDSIVPQLFMLVRVILFILQGISISITYIRSIFILLKQPQERKKKKKKKRGTTFTAATNRRTLRNPNTETTERGTREQSVNK